MPQVHIELDYHVSTLSETDAQYKKLEEGDPSGSFWGKHVTERMLGYEPEAVVSDSLNYFYDFDPETVDDNEWIERAFIRRHFFAPPSIAQKLDRPIDIIGGDSQAYNYKFQDSVDNSIFPLIPSIKLLGLIVGPSMMLTALQAYRNRLLAQTNPEAGGPIDPLIKQGATTEFTASRRSFVLYGAGVAGLINIGAGLAPVICAKLPTHALDDLMELTDLQDNFRPNNENNTWLDGRTALMIQKATEQSVMRDGAPVSVVMGNAHAHHAELFVSQEKARLKAIRRYVALMFKLAETTSDAFSGMTLEERRDEAFGELVGSCSFTVRPEGVSYIERNIPFHSQVIGDIALEELEASKK